MSYQFALMRNALRATYAALNREQDEDHWCDACKTFGYDWREGTCLNPECPSHDRKSSR